LSYELLSCKHAGDSGLAKSQVELRKKAVKALAKAFGCISVSTTEPSMLKLVLELANRAYVCVCVCVWM
jgi:hypothetical protein